TCARTRFPLHLHATPPGSSSRSGSPTTRRSSTRPGQEPTFAGPRRGGMDAGVRWDKAIGARTGRRRSKAPPEGPPGRAHDGLDIGESSSASYPRAHDGLDIGESSSASLSAGHIVTPTASDGEKMVKSKGSDHLFHQEYFEKLASIESRIQTAVL